MLNNLEQLDHGKVSGSMLLIPCDPTLTSVHADIRMHKVNINWYSNIMRRKSFATGYITGSYWREQRMIGNQ